MRALATSRSQHDTRATYPPGELNWVVVAGSDQMSGLAFQLAPDHQPPTWPGPAVPQQFHLGIMVEDVAAAGPRVLALRATKLDGQDVYADPAGHPFCLIRRPGRYPALIRQ
jgi:hypothetical protein